MKTIVQRGWERALGPLTASLLACFSAQATELVRYGFEGPTLAPSNVYEQVTVTDFAYVGSGTTNFLTGYPAGGSAYSHNQWPTTGGLGPYYGFTLTIGEGFIVALSDLSFAQQHSATGPRQWVVRYSTDGTIFQTLGAGDNLSSNAWHTHAAADLHPIDLTSAVYFRLYATNAFAAAGTWRVDDVTVNGTIGIDDGTRVFRSHGFDGAPSDNWGHATNAGVGTIARSTARQYTGAQSLALTGSAPGTADPNVVFDSVMFTNLLTNVVGDVEQVVVALAYSASGPDTDDDLYFDVSYSNGASWTDAGTAKLVDGFSSANIAFGATNAANPTTVGANPYTFALALSVTQVAARVRFDELSGANNSSDSYYVDDVQLSGVTIPTTNGPSISNYGGITGVTSNQATVRGHVRGGYPYPMVTVYWGNQDGGSNTEAWAEHTSLGTNRWGLFSTIFTNLVNGQQYFYRGFASNAYGAIWSATSTNLTTTALSASTNRALYLDSFGAATVMPVNIDRDGNGLSDRWENEYLGGGGNNANGDPDGDGVSTKREFTAGTNPNSSNSMMRIVGLDVASSTSMSVQISWAAGDFPGPATYSSVGDLVVRSFRVNAADEVVTNAKVARSTVSDGLSGTNTWMDTNAVSLYNARYYSVSVSFAGDAYTNTEEWAMHVQDRTAMSSNLICVPVNYGSAAANNVNSTLGVQLARGLHADGNPANADRISYLDAGQNWVYLYLLTNMSGTVYWCEDDFITPANVTVTPGMAFWVGRGSGAVYRNETVFGGKSYLDGSVSPMTFSIANGGWNLFGWPLPRARPHVNLGTNTPANQLGFESLASGGTGNLQSTPVANRGDKLWVWGGSEWTKFYWLMDHLGPKWDGKWWSDFDNDYASFSLEIGKGYFYRHVTNQWGGANFNWTPQSP